MLIYKHIHLLVPRNQNKYHHLARQVLTEVSRD